MLFLLLWVLGWVLGGNQACALERSGGSLIPFSLTFTGSQSMGVGQCLLVVFQDVTAEAPEREM